MAGPVIGTASKHGQAPNITTGSGPGDPKPKAPHIPGEGGVGGTPVKPAHQKNSGYMPYGDNEAPAPQDDGSAARTAATQSRAHAFQAQLGYIPDSGMTPTERAHQTADSTSRVNATNRLAVENGVSSAPTPAIAPEYEKDK